jgi:hypothetical protein
MFQLEPLIVSDFSKAMSFWRPVLSTIGYSPQHEFTLLQTFGKAPHIPNFSIVQGICEKTTVRLQVEDSEEVEEFYKKACEKGAKKVSEPEVLGGRFSGRFEDLDGNTVEVYCEELQESQESQE